MVRLALLGLLALSSVGAAGAPEEDVYIVEVGDMALWGYSPSRLTVEAGITVTWKNTGSFAHSVTSRDQLFDSRLMDAGDEWSLTFDTPGTYRYHCVPRPWMKGTIVVTPPERENERESEEEG
jgi:plastocyanin